MMVGGFIMLKKKIVVYSTLIGKAAQCLFVASLVMVHFHDWFAARCVGWFLTPDLIMLWLSVCLTLCALAKYVIWSVRTAKEKGVI